MKTITITGIAENSKAGANVITKDKEVYYLDGMHAWNDNVFKKSVVVEGNLSTEYYDEGNLKNEKGEYSQGFSGEIKKILKPAWRLAIQSTKNDSLLEKLKNSLPKGWTMKIENDKLVIKCKEQVYLLYENKINAPKESETSEQREDKFKKYGKLVNSQFVFILKNKLSDKEIEGIKSDNKKIYTSISELQKKLKEIPVSWKDGNYWPRNKEEEIMVSDFEKEKSKLESKIIKLPDYQSEKYALYLESEIGIETEFVSIFPEKCLEEMYKIKNEVFGKVLEIIK
jgi:hypothetical protein